MSRFARRLAALPLLALLTAAPAARTAVSDGRPKGSLVIVGGGERDEAMMRRFVALAGGPGARIAVVPMASEEAETSGAAVVSELDSLGARPFVFLVDRAQAGTAEAAHRLDTATGVWFCGGDQARLTTVLARHAPRSGRSTPGTRRGRSSAARRPARRSCRDSMITGDQTPPGDTTGYYGDEYPPSRATGSRSCPASASCTAPSWTSTSSGASAHNRLMSAVLERPSLLGVGIDESTAIEVAPDGRWRVLGESDVDRVRRPRRPTSRRAGGAAPRRHRPPGPPAAVRQRLRSRQRPRHHARAVARQSQTLGRRR